MLSRTIWVSLNGHCKKNKRYMRIIADKRSCISWEKIGRPPPNPLKWPCKRFVFVFWKAASVIAWVFCFLRGPSVTSIGGPSVTTIFFIIGLMWRGVAGEVQVLLNGYLSVKFVWLLPMIFFRDNRGSKIFLPGDFEKFWIICKFIYKAIHCIDC